MNKFHEEVTCCYFLFTDGGDEVQRCSKLATDTQEVRVSSGVSAVWLPGLCVKCKMDEDTFLIKTEPANGIG